MCYREREEGLYSHVRKYLGGEFRCEHVSVPHILCVLKLWNTGNIALLPGWKTSPTLHKSEPVKENKRKREIKGQD